MKLDKLAGERFRERPADCAIDSHALMVKGGYIKNVANGIFSLYTPLRRVTKKIEAIIREEMDAVDGQEVLFPVVMPASLWEESGRYSNIGGELVRFHDRNKNPLVLGMTHEEAAVHLVRESAVSYTKYPFMIYQIQTKFRDEARPRGGLIRVREFTMKDAYSFHTSQADLEEYYEKCHRAYMNIFSRAGIPEVVSIASDSGMMGGSVSHEFMLLTPVGEDSVVLCGDCGYKANMEAAECITANDNANEESAPLTLTHTPGAHSIEEVCAFLKSEKEKSCKAVVYQDAEGKYAAVFIRGDLEINETKLTNHLGYPMYPAAIADDSDLVEGFIGPHNLDAKCTVLFDKSLEGAKNLICGGNTADYHYTGLDMARDVGANLEYRDYAKIKEGGICPKCGNASITISRGIEVGNIFQLGTKYSKAMNMTYLDENAQLQNPVMGCYGIGVGRLAASVCEVSNDENGPIWPMAIAPWQVHICAIRADDAEVRAAADALYSDLQKQGAEVIYDDRNVSAGVMFADADLLGVPLRLIVSPRNLKNGICEMVSRDKAIKREIPLAETAAAVKETIAEMLAQK